MNNIITDIEVSDSCPELRHTAVVPYQHIGLTNPVPGGLSKVLGASRSDGSEAKIIPAGTSWSVLDDDLPTTSEPTESYQVEGEVVDSGRTWVTIDDPDSLLPIPAAGAGIVVTPGGVDEEPLISWVAPACKRIGTKLAIATPGAQGEFQEVFTLLTAPSYAHINIAPTFLAIDGIKKLRRVTQGSDKSPMPPTWDEVIVSGLEALGEEQTKKASPDAIAARNKYEGLKSRMTGWATANRSGMPVKRLSTISLPRRSW